MRPNSMNPGAFYGVHGYGVLEHVGVGEVRWDASQFAQPLYEVPELLTSSAEDGRAKLVQTSEICKRPKIEKWILTGGNVLHGAIRALEPSNGEPSVADIFPFDCNDFRGTKTLPIGHQNH